MKIEKVRIIIKSVLAVLNNWWNFFSCSFGFVYFSVIQEHRRYDYNEPETRFYQREKIEKLQKEK
jgi:hypothetical protein